MEFTPERFLPVSAAEEENSGHWGLIKGKIVGMIIPLLPWLVKKNRREIIPQAAEEEWEAFAALRKKSQVIPKTTCLLDSVNRLDRFYRLPVLAPLTRFIRIALPFPWRAFRHPE